MRGADSRVLEEDRGRECEDRDGAGGVTTLPFRVGPMNEREAPESSPGQGVGCSGLSLERQRYHSFNLLRHRSSQHLVRLGLAFVLVGVSAQPKSAIKTGPATKEETLAQPALPDKPSIAVLRRRRSPATARNAVIPPGEANGSIRPLKVTAGKPLYLTSTWTSAAHQRRRKQAHMRGCNPPTRPSVRIQTWLWRPVADTLRCRVGRRQSGQQIVIRNETSHWPSDTKRRDRLMPIEIFGDSDSKHERALPEELVEHGDVIGDRRAQKFS